MNINRGKLCAGAIALLTTTLSLVPNLAEAKLAETWELERKDLNIPTEYKGWFCIILGPIQNKADVRLHWGPFEGTREIFADDRGPNESYGVEVRADGNNVAATLYTSRGLGSAYPQVDYQSCESRGISHPASLDWSRR